MPATDLDPQKPEARAVLEFWFQDALQLGWPSQDLSGLWFGGGAALDRDIDLRFGGLVRQAVSGELTEWEAHPLERLALVVVLDQFTRNVFRGQAKAFAGDVRAQALVLDALAQGWDQHLPLAGRVFLCMPLMHAEASALQEECVRRFQALVLNATSEHREKLQGHLEYAEKHRDIIAAYGRFPYRNAALERSDTAREQEFLRSGPRFGQ